MDQDAARTATESLELVFQMSNILDTGLDRHTLSVLIALCDLGLNPEALAAVVKEFRNDPPVTSSTPSIGLTTTMVVMQAAGGVNILLLPNHSPFKKPPSTTIHLDRFGSYLA
ncbi:hypothetical protein SSX86_012493 [Deinandra increscens subsp. villosa]|uniref:Mitotic-spindle organizing protein 1 n=1 Tax=Deinandra increscens subsp. villosa TaxID=3103831 RepID=A0AAP0D4C5_9ASTR